MKLTVLWLTPLLLLALVACDDENAAVLRGTLVEDGAPGEFFIPGYATQTLKCVYNGTDDNTLPKRRFVRVTHYRRRGDPGARRPARHLCSGRKRTCPNDCAGGEWCSQPGVKPAHAQPVRRMWLDLIASCKHLSSAFTSPLLSAVASVEWCEAKPGREIPATLKLTGRTNRGGDRRCRDRSDPKCCLQACNLRILRRQRRYLPAVGHRTLV